MSRRIMNDIKKCLELENFNIVDTGLVTELKVIYRPFMTNDETFQLSVKLPTDYPFSPPVVLFNSKVLHPNIDKEGKMCLEILNNWKTSYTLSKVLIDLHILFCNPDLDNVINVDAYTVWQKFLEDNLVNDLINRIINI